jgi:hypothetical protein
MTPIILSEEQVRLLEGATPPIVLLDPQGRKLGEIQAVESSSDRDSLAHDAWTQEALRRKERAVREGLQGSSTQEVLARLRAIKPE